MLDLPLRSLTNMAGDITVIKTRFCHVCWLFLGVFLVFVGMFACLEAVCNYQCFQTFVAFASLSL